MPAKRVDPTAWKPRVCADCPARFPSFNRDGGRPGTPWRCAKCDAVAKPLPPDDPFAPAPPGLLL